MTELAAADGQTCSGGREGLSEWQGRARDGRDAANTPLEHDEAAGTVTYGYRGPDDSDYSEHRTLTRQGG